MSQLRRTQSYSGEKMVPEEGDHKNQLRKVSGDFCLAFDKEEEFLGTYWDLIVEQYRAFLRNDKHYLLSMGIDPSLEDVKEILQKAIVSRNFSGLKTNLTIK